MNPLIIYRDYRDSDVDIINVVPRMHGKGEFYKGYGNTSNG